MTWNCEGTGQLIVIHGTWRAYTDANYLAWKKSGHGGVEPRTLTTSLCPGCVSCGRTSDPVAPYILKTS